MMNEYTKIYIEDWANFKKELISMYRAQSVDESLKKCKMERWSYNPW